jgi:hypothetical protein
VAAILALAAGCTDASLFSSERGAGQADRVALSGRICTEDPLEARLPLRVIVAGDVAQGPLFGTYDPATSRVNTLSSFVQSALTDDDTSLAVVSFAGLSRRLAPLDAELTRNPGELFAGINQLGLPVGCSRGGRCRDPIEALRSIRALIQGDLESTPPGLRVATQYVVLFVTAGPADPLAVQVDCCAPDDAGCLDAEPAPSLACERELELAEVTGMQAAIREAGAVGLRFHVVHLAAADAATNDIAASVLRDLAQAGDGTYQRFDAISGLSPSALNLLGARQSLRVKTLLVENPHAQPSSAGPLLDSDADGLPDAQELRLGSSPTTRDTDGDGIGDLVEVLVGFEPTVPEMPVSCAGLDPFVDRDFDGLFDCDEALLGTEATLADTDGDGMPDPFEVRGRTDYLTPDDDEDTDGDGVSNGEELRQRSDPRSTDVATHLAFGVRAEIEDEGVTEELVALDLLELRAVQVEPSAGTTAGVGVLLWDPVGRTLAWRDGSDGTEGDRVSVDPEPGEEFPAGELLLGSSSYAPSQGEEGRFLRVTVDETDFALPDEPVSEAVRIVRRRRECLSYTVRNIRLMPTLALDDGSEAGLNRLLLYFLEAPPGRLDAPGPFRISEIPVLFDPPDRREPAAAVLTVFEEEFVRPRL